MKKIFTLALFSCIVTVSFAQFADNHRRNDKGSDAAYGNRNNRNYDYREKKFNYFSRQEMQMEMNEINRNYNRKIEEVKCNLYMGSYRKRRLINELERRRDEEIKVVYLKFKDPCNRSNDHDYGNRW
jgi:hypothetical protein